MTTHTDLIARLRGWPNLPGLNLDKDLMREAAEALESLAAELAAAKVDADRYRALRLTVTAHNERRPFWEWHLADMSGNLGLTPEGLDSAADGLRQIIAAARAQPTKETPNA